MAKPDDQVWVDVISYLRTKHIGICRQWFEDIEPVGVSDGVFRARMNNPIRRQYLQRECLDLFNEALQSTTGRLLSVSFVDQELIVESKPLPKDQHTAPNGHSSSNGKELARPGSWGEMQHGCLAIIPDYTFENFIVGPENRLAHAAATAVALKPAISYNPLFIHGGVGLGKTHLLQAICLKLLADKPDRVLYYVSCEEFMTQFMDAVQAGQMQDFRHRFRDVDVLIIDDIHFLAKRDRTQEEFFHTFNTLYQSKKQIVLSSDAPPQDIPDLEDRLVSRFKSGLVVEVSPPTYDTRVQIVKQKGLIRGLKISDEVACFIATRVQTNIRELEGAITKVHMQSVADNCEIDANLAKIALEPLRNDGVRPEITITGIIDAVIDYYSVKLTDLQSKRRQKSIAHPRQVCMYLARKHTRYSLEEIGGYFGGRDHTTVMHAVRTIDRKCNDDSDLRQLLKTLEGRI